MKAVHAEMEDALHERDELKIRIHSYITEVSRIETLIATKVRGNYDCYFEAVICHFQANMSFDVYAIPFVSA